MQVSWERRRGKNNFKFPIALGTTHTLWHFSRYLSNQDDIKYCLNLQFDIDVLKRRSEKLWSWKRRFGWQNRDGNQERDFNEEMIRYLSIELLSLFDCQTTINIGVATISYLIYFLYHDKFKNIDLSIFLFLKNNCQ